MTRILVVDNHDSFVHILVGYLDELGARTAIVEADELVDIPDALAAHDGVMISPGPGRPTDAGAGIPLVRAAADAGTPILGVCLGHQVIAEAFGATVEVAPELVHGLSSPVTHEGTGLFAGLPSPFEAGRYHSLAVREDSLPAELEVTARTDTGVIMGIRHRALPIVGVQFHPESVLTAGGHTLLGNWLRGIRRA